MSFDATQPADGLDAASVDDNIRTNFAGIQKGDHWTAASEPSYKEQGSPWYDSSTDIFKIYDGSGWQTWRFGAWVVRSENTVYQAATDGFFVGYVLYSGVNSCGEIIAYTDSSTPPTTVRARACANIPAGGGDISYLNVSGNFMVPVKKGDYYKSYFNNRQNASGYTRIYYWIPMGV